MIETIPHNGGLGLKRMMARRMARRTGQAMMFAEDIDVARERLDRVGETAPCAKDVDINQTEIAGVSALSFQLNDPRPGTLIYCHGGGFFVGSAHSHKALVSWICKAAKVNALSINYGLAPEHVCPEGVEDCERVLKTL